MRKGGGTTHTHPFHTIRLTQGASRVKCSSRSEKNRGEGYCPNSRAGVLILVSRTQEKIVQLMGRQRLEAFVAEIKYSIKTIERAQKLVS